MSRTKTPGSRTPASSVRDNVWKASVFSLVFALAKTSSARAADLFALWVPASASDCRAAARIEVAEMINDARAMGASGCRVEVIA